MLETPRTAMASIGRRLTAVGVGSAGAALAAVVAGIALIWVGTGSSGTVICTPAEHSRDQEDGPDCQPYFTILYRYLCILVSQFITARYTASTVPPGKKLEAR